MNKLLDFTRQTLQVTQSLPYLTLTKHCKVHPESLIRNNRTNNSQSEYLQYDKEYVAKHSRVSEKHLDELFCTDFSHPNRVMCITDLEDLTDEGE